MRPAPLATWSAGLAGVVALGLLGTPAVSAGATSQPADLSSTQGLRKAVKVAGIQEHLDAFQNIADANGGDRSAGSAGYAASADYVTARLEAAGYTVTRQTFDFDWGGEVSPPELAQVSPTPVTYVAGTDFLTMTESGSGDTTATVVPVDLALAAPYTSTSACEAADFAGFPAGSIALIQRGTCTFSSKVANAAAAGATGAIIFNQGNTPDRTGLFSGTLQSPQATIPVVATSYAFGASLAATPGVVMRLKVDWRHEQRPTTNVLASTSGSAKHTVVVGAALDSNRTSPGINQEGSGAATLLEVAEAMAAKGISPRNRVQLAFWAGRFQGNLGAQYYLDQLSAAQQSQIEVYVDLEALGSSNFVRFVLDGDASAGPGGSDGSDQVEQVFRDYFGAVGLASDEQPLALGNDYLPFVYLDIPTGGLTSGVAGLKTTSQAATYGGTAGQPYDPCAFLVCDTTANVSTTALDQMSDAAAHGILTLAKRNYDKRPLRQR